MCSINRKVLELQELQSYRRHIEAIWSLLLLQRLLHIERVRLSNTDRVLEKKIIRCGAIIYYTALRIFVNC